MFSCLRRDWIEYAEEMQRVLEQPPDLRVVNVLFDDRYGGPSKRVIQVAQELAKHGVRTTLCLPAGDGNAADVAQEAGVPVRRLDFGRIPRPRNPVKVLRWALRLPGDIRRFVALFRDERPDVAHVNGAFFVAPALAAKLARVPLVWHLNDTILPARVAPVFGALVRALADRIVVAAEAVARHYKVTRASHTVVYAPVDVREYEAAPENEENGAYRVGLVANWNPLKGLEYFVRATALVRERLNGELEVVFAGARLKTYADYARRVDDLVEALGLRPAVREYGFVPSVAPILAGLDVLVLSSTTEASPMAVLEGMAAGVPVVATDVGGVREIICGDPENPAGIVVPPYDPEALAEAILALIENSEEAVRMGRNGRRLTEKRFSLDICARRHLEVYSTLVEDTDNVPVS